MLSMNFSKETEKISEKYIDEAASAKEVVAGSNKRENRHIL